MTLALSIAMLLTGLALFILPVASTDLRWLRRRRQRKAELTKVIFTAMAKQKQATDAAHQRRVKKAADRAIQRLKGKGVL